MCVCKLWVLFLTKLHQFLNTAKEQFEVLEGMYKKMTTMFQNTAKYFAFDPKKYTMEEFFTDMKSFIESFNVCIIWCFFLKFCAAFSFTGCFLLPSLVNALTPLVGRQEEHLTCKKLDIGLLSVTKSNAAVKLSLPANQYPTFCRPDVLHIAQPMVSEHWREKVSHSMGLLTQSPLNAPIYLGESAKPLVVPLMPVPQYALCSIENWNRLPMELRHLHSTPLSKHKLKTFLFTTELQNWTVNWTM